MSVDGIDIGSIRAFTREADPGAGLGSLLRGLNGLAGAHEFLWVLTRGSWYRLGGVVDAQYRRVSANLLQWIEQESDGDLNDLLLNYGDQGYFATRLTGRTHYFTWAYGAAPTEFVQLEIDRDYPYESMEELIDPLDYPRLEPEPVAGSYYAVRRLLDIGTLVMESLEVDRSGQDLRRFFQDWQNSSAGDAAHFSQHWALAIREYPDSDGERRFDLRPVSNCLQDALALPQQQKLRGADLANAIHGIDRKAGYPFAWFFAMLSCKGHHSELAEAVLRDQMGAYDYLPPRDLKVLRRWEEQPYGV
jgi:hypothetical protein